MGGGREGRRRGRSEGNWRKKGEAIHMGKKERQNGMKGGEGEKKNGERRMKKERGSRRGRGEQEGRQKGNDKT